MPSLKKAGILAFSIAFLGTSLFLASNRIQNEHLRYVDERVDQAIALYKQAAEEGNAQAILELKKMADTRFFGAVIFAARIESQAGNIQRRDQYIRDFMATGSDLEIYPVLQQVDFVFDNAGTAEYIRRAYDAHGRYKPEAMKELASTFSQKETEALQACYSRLSSRFGSLEDKQISVLDLWSSILNERFGWPRGSCSLPTPKAKA